MRHSPRKRQEPPRAGRWPCSAGGESSSREAMEAPVCVCNSSYLKNSKKLYNSYINFFWPYKKKSSRRIKTALGLTLFQLSDKTLSIPSGNLGLPTNSSYLPSGTKGDICSVGTVPSLRRPKLISSVQVSMAKGNKVIFTKK